MKVYNKTVKQSIILELIKKIKQKKELANIDSSIIKEKIQELLKQDKKLLSFLSEAESFSEIKRSKNTGKIVKPIRKELRLLYGVYQVDSKRLKQLLDRLKKDRSIAVHKKILSLHLSSKERLPIYEKFYKDIFKITGIPESIIDIASGLNPFSYPFMKTKAIYTAVELNKKDADIINQYFKIMKIKGKALAADITKRSLKLKADIAFAFKIFDLIPNKAVEKITKQLKVRYIIASFPTKTLSKKRMNYIKRGGFQRMLKRLRLSYKKIEYSNELIYIIKKS
jgi:16S rRNA (guanine(1405)-N(7))-methyltransferase